MLLSHLEVLACVIVYPSCCFSVHILVLSLLLKKKKTSMGSFRADVVAQLVLLFVFFYIYI